MRRTLVLEQQYAAGCKDEKQRKSVYLKDEKIGKGEGFIALPIQDGGGIKVCWKDLEIKELK